MIAIIRGSANRADARENLVTTSPARRSTSTPPAALPSFDPEKPFTPIQADAILELQLHRLTRLSIDEITKELEQTRENIAEFESILGSEKKLRNVIIKELEEVKKQYGDERRTVIEDEAAEIMLEDLIADEQVAVTVSHSRLSQAHAISTYRNQRRGGTGRMGMKTRDEDFVEHLFIASTHAYILIFTNTGRVYWLKVYEIPDIGAAGKGKHVGNLVALQPGETVRTMLAVRNLEEESRYIFFATRNGTVKKTEAQRLLARDVARHHRHQHRAGRRTGRRHTHRRQPDHLPGIARWPGHPLRRERCPLHGAQRHRRTWHEARRERTTSSAWRQLRKIREAEADWKKPRPSWRMPPPKSPTWFQIKGSLILSVTENGYGKRTPADEYRLQGRGGSGVINVKTTERNGKVVGISQVSEKSEVMLISQYGKIIRIDSSTIRESGRSAQGVRLLAAGDRVAAAVVIPLEEEPTARRNADSIAKRQIKNGVRLLASHFFFNLSSRRLVSNAIHEGAQFARP